MVEELSEMYKQELAGKRLVYDGAGSLFTLGPLPQNILEFSVVPEGKRSKTKSFISNVFDADLTLYCVCFIVFVKAAVLEAVGARTGMIRRGRSSCLVSEHSKW